MNRTALLALFTGVALAACAQTTSTQASADAVPVNKVAATDNTTETSTDYDPNERVCETREVPGSIIPKKVCMTRAEKEELRKQAKESVGQSQRNSLRTCAAGAGCGGG